MLYLFHLIPVLGWYHFLFWNIAKFWKWRNFKRNQESEKKISRFWRLITVINNEFGLGFHNEYLPQKAEF